MSEALEQLLRDMEEKLRGIHSLADKLDEDIHNQGMPEDIDCAIALRNRASELIGLYERMLVEGVEEHR